VPDPGTAATWSIIFAKEEGGKNTHTHTQKHKTPFPLPYLTQNYLEEAPKKILNKEKKNYKQTKKKNLHKANNSFPFSLLLGKRKLRRLCTEGARWRGCFESCREPWAGAGEKREVGR